MTSPPQPPRPGLPPQMPVQYQVVEQRRRGLTGPWVALIIVGVLVILPALCCGGLFLTGALTAIFTPGPSPTP